MERSRNGFHSCSSLCSEVCDSLTHWTKQHLYPREAAGISIAACLAIAFVLCVFFIFDTRITATQEWSQEPWIAANCTMLASGIEYIGDCSDQKVQNEVKDYEEAGHVNVTLSKCPVDTCPGTKETSRRLASAQNTVYGILCRDLYVPWAHVQPVITEVLKFEAEHPERIMGCSFRTGLARHSTLPTLAEAMDLKNEITAPSGEQINVTTCWLLNIDSDRVQNMARWTAGSFGVSWRQCAQRRWAVSLQDPVQWPEANEVWVMFRHCVRASLLISAVFCAVLSVSMSLWKAHCWYTGIRHWDDLLPGDATTPRFPSESARVRELQERWAIFRASMIAEYHIVSVDEKTDSQLED